MEERARRRIPFFAWEYLASGTGADEGLQRNLDALKAVTLTPQFMKGEFQPQLSTELFGTQYAAPFGVAPVGLTGLMWPGAECMLARMAARYNIPYGLSTVATEMPETIGPLAKGMGWFQLYPPRDPDTRKDLLKRAKAAGFTVLMITVDVPASSRRERQARAGVSVPPVINPTMLYRCSVRPAWSLATLLHGIPRFRGLEPYIGTRNMSQMADFIGTQFNGTLDWDYVQRVREEWDGPVVLKGVLDASEAERAVDVGLDGIVVSNHGARQFDAAPAAIDALPKVAAAVGSRTTLIYDSGVRGGLDIIRALALGADFVLLGRAYMFGVAALGEAGGDHVTDLLMADLSANMAQIGCARLEDLHKRLDR
ncbi:MAG: alpha-hydroxy-acid oxidizing protein [Chromatiales bacterium]|nr:alpha-hydroxy-acid oxidizing protein [Chromatiales bacterium]